ncbi:Actin cytoskeleton-regulatory complex protein [Trichinella pseudospiralis]
MATLFRAVDDIVRIQLEQWDGFRPSVIGEIENAIELLLVTDWISDFVACVWYFYAFSCILLGYFKDEVDCAQRYNNTAILKLSNAESKTTNSREKHVNSFNKKRRHISNDFNEESLISNPPCDDKSCSDLPSIFIDSKCCRDENGRNLGQCCKKLSLLTKILIAIASFGTTMGLLFVIICFSNGKCCVALRKSLNIRRKAVIDESANLTNFKHAKTLERSLSNGKKLNDMNRTFQESLMYSRNSKIDSALLDFVQDADMKPTLSAESFNSKAVESQELSITENETNMKSEPNQSVWNEASKNETELPLEKLIPIHDSTHNTYNPNNSQYLKPKSSKKFDFLASSSLSNDGSSKFIGNSNSEESLNSENPSSSADIANSNVCSNLSAEFTAASSKRESTLDSPITEDKSDNASNSCYNTSATRNPQKPVAAARNLSKSSTSHLT